VTEPSQAGEIFFYSCFNPDLSSLLPHL
jgi:hypothetical protein